MGNICRSPTAEGVFRHFAVRHSELPELEVDSCGTIGYHAGEPPDPRSVSAAKLRGYDLSRIRSRKISYQDLVYFDHILAMDNENLNNLFELANHEESLIPKIKLFLEFGNDNSINQVPDPYYGGHSGFDHVIDLIEDASQGFIDYLMK